MCICTYFSCKEIAYFSIKEFAQKVPWNRFFNSLLLTPFAQIGRGSTLCQSTYGSQWEYQALPHKSSELSHGSLGTHVELLPLIGFDRIAINWFLFPSNHYLLHLFGFSIWKSEHVIFVKFREKPINFNLILIP